MAGTLNIDGKDLNYKEAAAAYASGLLTPPKPPGQDRLTVDEALASVFPDEHAAVKNATKQVADITIEDIIKARGVTPTDENIAAQLEVWGVDGLEDLTKEELKDKLLQSKSVKRAADNIKKNALDQAGFLTQQTDRLTNSEGKLQASDMEHPFAGAYPGDTGSDNVRDYIVFTAFSNDVAGYTKASTVGGESQGDAASLEGTVQLYIPENLSVNSQVGYRNTEGGSLAGTFGNVALSEGDEANLDVMSNLLSSITGQVAAGVETTAVMAQTSGLAGVGAANRHVLFEGVDFRTFSYAYEFLPKSWEESDMLRKIIKFFRIQMLPEIRGNGNTFNPPNYFTIEYMIDGSPTNYLNKIKPTVCTGCDVSYGGNGQFAMFQSDGGEEPAPALINLTLTFQEVQVVSKQDAMEGY